MGKWHGTIWNQQQGSRRLAGARHGRWLINILKCHIWVQPKMNSPTTCIGYSKWDISLCNATMTALLRCVPLPWDCDTPYFQITQVAVASQRVRGHRSYVRRYQNSSVWESQEPSSVCQSWYHNVIKRRSAVFHWRDRQFGHARPPAVLYSICCQPATRTRNS